MTNISKKLDDHYTALKLEPWDIIEANGLDFWEGNVLKYLLRWRKKDGLKDLIKARNYLDKMIEINKT